ncbi:MAG: CDP-alcohol phosphatidyltransferase family protein [Kineosporiaceae bacterium]
MTADVAPQRGLAAAATAFTALRLALAVPVAVLMGQDGRAAAALAGGVVAVAIATDLLDGRAARAAGSAGRGGQLFDHGTDCLFAGRRGPARRRAVAAPGPRGRVVLQYVGDSWWADRAGGLRGNRLGHVNGVLYFAPPVVDVLARLGLLPAAATQVLAWALVVTTAVSMGQRAAWSVSRRRASGTRPGGRPAR